MSNTPTSPGLQPGDVIVRKDLEHMHRYIVGSLEHRAELIYANRNAAIAHGTRYALAQGVG